MGSIPDPPHPGSADNLEPGPFRPSEPPTPAAEAATSPEGGTLPDDAALRDPFARLLERGALAERCKAARREGRKIVFTNGCFDLIHAGHVQYLADARSLGDLLVLGLNSDTSVRRLKGPVRPVVGERDRALVLLSLRAVDWVSIFPEDTPLELIRAIRPDILAKGGDYRPEDVVGREVVEAYGGSVRIVPFRPGYSSSSLVMRIRDGFA